MENGLGAVGSLIGLSSGIGGLGILGSLVGGIGSAATSSEISGVEQQKANVSMNTAGLEMQQDTVRQQAMEMSARRSQLEDVRNTQRARANAMAADVNQGANQGTGAKGGLASVTNQGYYGLQGINQSLQSGEQMFSLNKSVDQNKITMAQLGGQESSLQSQAAMYGGISSLGGSFIKAGPTLGNIFGGSGGGGTNNQSFNPFSYTGSLY